MDVRTLTFKSKFPPPMLTMMAKGKVEQMDKESKELGIKDIDSQAGQGRAVQREFYAAAVANRGIPDEQVQASVEHFRQAWAKLEELYSANEYLVGGALSLADVAIWVDVERIMAVKPDSWDLEKEFPCLVGAYRRLGEQVQGLAEQEGSGL